MRDLGVLIVDDQPLMLHALNAFLGGEEDVHVVGTAKDGVEAVTAARSLRPDVVLMDLKMPRMSGIEATRKIVSELPDVRVIALTTFSTLDQVIPTLRAGASGFLVKDAQPEEILEAMRQAMDDNLALSPSVVQLLARSAAGQEPAGAGVADNAGLAPREVSVIQLLAKGLSNREIAADLYISESSVKAYLASACGKLGVRDRLQALIRGYELGLVTPRLGETAQ